MYASSVPDICLMSIVQIVQMLHVLAVDTSSNIESPTPAIIQARPENDYEDRH